MMFGRGRSGVGDPEMTDSERRHADVVRFGRVSQVNYTTARVRVKIGDEDDADGHLETGWLPMAGGRAKGDLDWHPLEVGEDVMVLSESGELQNGMVLPASRYSSDNPAPGDKAGLWRKRFADGATIEYDRDSGAFLVDAKSDAKLKVGSTSVEVKTDEVIVTVGGATIDVKSDKITLTVSGVSMELSGDGVKFAGGSIKHDDHKIDKTHKHLGVTAGGATSGIPE